MNTEVNSNTHHLKSKKMEGVTLFLMLVFGFVLILTLCQIYGHRTGKTGITSDLQMLTPAMAVMLVAKLRNNDSLYPKKSFHFYLVAGFLLLGLACLGQFVNINVFDVNVVVHISIIVLGLCFILGVLNEEEEITKKWSLLGGSFIKSFKWIFIFVVCLYFYCFIMQLVLGKEIFSISKPVNLQSISTVVLKSLWNWRMFLTCFGEEYGWRFFLQPRLQCKFGKRIGVILVGIIHGAWHVNFTYLAILMYNIPQPKEFFVYACLLRLVICIALAIVWAYFYEKSRSIWCIAFIHCFYNSFTQHYGMMNGLSIQNNYKHLVMLSIVSFVIVSLFFLSKVFWKDKNPYDVEGK